MAIATIKPDSEFKKARWDLARNTANKLTAIYSWPPVPVLEIAENNGVNVVYHEITEFSEDVSGLCDFEGKRLYVNANDPSRRQRFTVAHELGHWLLHKDKFLADPEAYQYLPRFQKVETNTAEEMEANLFAACLLVPKKLLAPIKKKFPSASPAILADIFLVSIEMMENRLKNVR